LLDHPGIGLGNHELVITCGDIPDRELSVRARDSVVGIVHDVDPTFHPTMGVTVDAHRSSAFQLDRNALVLVRQSKIEGGAFPIIAMGVVQHRIGVDDIQ
jgi:hypothetical protein